MTLEQKPGVPPPAATVTVTPPPAPVAPVKTPEEIAAEVRAKYEADLKKLTEDTERKVREATDRINAVTGYHERRYKAQEAALKAAQQKLQELDPNAGDSIELARYRTNDSLSQEQMRQEAERQAQIENHARIMADLETFVTDNGIDKNDPRIDWGSDAKTYPDLYKRVHLSVTKINKENVQKARDEVEKTKKEAEERIKKETSDDSVNTTLAGGASGSKDWKDIQAAYIKNPRDPKVVRAYNEAKQARGR